LIMYDRAPDGRSSSSSIANSSNMRPGSFNPGRQRSRSQSPLGDMTRTSSDGDGVVPGPGGQSLHGGEKGVVVRATRRHSFTTVDPGLRGRRSPLSNRSRSASAASRSRSTSSTGAVAVALVDGAGCIAQHRVGCSEVYLAASSSARSSGVISGGSESSQSSVRNDMLGPRKLVSSNSSTCMHTRAGASSPLRRSTAAVDPMPSRGSPLRRDSSPGTGL
jgi:hypothetical protein